MYKQTEPKRDVLWGEGRVEALASWTDGHAAIHCITDDHCYVFLLEDAEGVRPLQWIPVEVVDTLTSVRRTADSRPAESSAPTHTAAHP